MLLQIELCIFNKRRQTQLAARGHREGELGHGFGVAWLQPPPHPGAPGAAVWPVGDGGAGAWAPWQLETWEGRRRGPGGSRQCLTAS